MAIRLRWTAYSPNAARTMLRELQDQMRGAAVTSVRPAGFRPRYVTWQGRKEAAADDETSCMYGVTFWVEPYAEFETNHGA